MSCPSTSSKHEDFRLLFRIKLNQISMMKDRGFDITSEDGLFGYDLSSFKNHYDREAEKETQKLKDASKGKSVEPVTIREKLNRSYFNSNTNSHVYVHYLKRSKGDVSMGEISGFIKIIDETSYSYYILITNNKLNSSAREAVISKSKKINVFIDEDLHINPTKHNNVPLHSLIPRDEARVIIERNSWDTAKLPKLLPSNIISRWYDFQPGQLIYIDRETVFPGTMVDFSLYYRFVPNDTIAGDDEEPEPED